MKKATKWNTELALELEILSFTKTMKKQWKSVNIGPNAGNRKLFKQIFIRMIVNVLPLSFEKMYSEVFISFEKMQNRYYI